MSPGRTRLAPVPSVDGLVPTVATVLLMVSFVVVLPGGLYRFVLPKLLVVAVAVVLASLSPAAGRLPRPVVWAALGCGGVLVLAALTSAAPLAQLVGRWPRYEGLVALPLYAGAAWAGARLLGPGASDRRRHLALVAVAGASVVLGGVSLAEAAGLRPLGGDVTRPGALLGNASDQGTVAAMLLGLLAAAATRVRSTLALGATAAGLTVVASGSRAGLGAALVAVVVAGVGRAAAARPGRRARAVWAFAGAAVVLTGVALVWPSQRLTGDPLAVGAQGRSMVWDTAAGVWSGHQWLGVGPSGFGDQATRHLPSSWWDTEDPTMALDSPHSLLLQVTAGGGVLMLVTVVALGVAVVWAARHRWRTTVPADRSLWWGATAALSAFVVALSVSFTSAATVPLAAALLGALVARPPRTCDHGGLARVGGRRRPGPTVAAGGPGRPRGPVGQGPANGRRIELTAAAWTVVAGTLALLLVPAVAAERPLAQAQTAAVRGDTASVERALRSAQHLRPWDADIDLLGACQLAPLALRGDRAAAAGAAAHADRALTRLPDSTEAMRCGIEGHLGLGDLVAARTQLDRALRLAPDNPELLLLSGYTYAAAGQLGQARTALQAAADNPYTARRAQELLAQVDDALAGRPDPG